MSNPLLLSAQATTGPGGGVLDRPTARLDPITIRVFETRTGRVAATMPYVGTPTWERGINTAGSWRVAVPLDNDEVSLELLNGVTDPWLWSWAVCQGSKIWQAGPLVTESYDGGTTTTFGGGGLLKLFTDKRVLLNPGRAALGVIAGTDADTVFGPAGYTPVIGGTVPAGNQNLSLHTIAKRLIQQDISTTGRELPIVFPDDVAGTAQREYPGYDLASLGQRLMELSQVLDGPEFEFAPEFADTTTKQSIRWRLRLGSPYLGDLTFARYWEYRKALVDTRFDTDGGYRTTRDFERGNGMNRDLVIGFADQPLGSAPAEMVLEDVGNDHTSASDTDTLNAWAAATVAGGQSAAPTLTHIVRVAGDNGEGFATGSPALGEVDTGDNCIAVYRGHPRLGTASYAGRITDIANGSDETTAVLTCQLLGRVEA
jgi:hypothetical protein